MEQYYFVPRNFRGADPEPVRTNMDHIENVMIIITDFQKKMKQPEFHAARLIVVQIPVHPVLLKQQSSDEYIHMMQTKHPQWKTLPQDYLHRLCGQSFLVMTQLTAIPQQYSPAH